MTILDANILNMERQPRIRTIEEKNKKKLIEFLKQNTKLSADIKPNSKDSKRFCGPTHADK